MELSITAVGFCRADNMDLLDDLLPFTAPAVIWTRGAVFLTTVATALAATAAVIFLSKLHISRFRRRITLVRHLSFTSSEDDDDSSLSASDSDENDGEENDELEEGGEEENRLSDFSGRNVNGMGNFNFSSFSLADLVGGMGVVKAWDGAGLGLDRSGGVVSFFDINRGEILSRSFNGGAALSTGVDLAWPAEIVSAADEASGAVVRVWDARVPVENPALTAGAVLRRRIAGIKAWEGKVFLGDEGGEISAVDLRNLAQVEGGGEGSSCWWRSAAMCLNLLSPHLENAQRPFRLPE